MSPPNTGPDPFLIPLRSPATPAQVARRATVLLGQACIDLFAEPPQSDPAARPVARRRRAQCRAIVRMHLLQKNVWDLVDCGTAASRDGDMRIARDAFRAAAALGA